MLSFQWSRTVLLICLILGIQIACFGQVADQPGVNQVDTNVELTRRANFPRLVFNRLGHVAPINSLSFDPKGEYLASGGQDKVVHIWKVPKVGEPGGLKLVTSIRPNQTPNGGEIRFIEWITRTDQGKSSYDLAVGGAGYMSTRGDFQVFRTRPGAESLSFGLTEHIIKDSESDNYENTSDPEQRRQYLDNFKGHFHPLTSASVSPNGRFFLTHQEFSRNEVATGKKDRSVVWRVSEDGNSYRHALTIDSDKNIVAGVFADDDTIVYVTDGGNGSCQLHRLQIQPIINYSTPREFMMNEPIVDLEASLNANVIRFVDKTGGVLEYRMDNLQPEILYENPDKTKRNFEVMAHSQDHRFVALLFHGSDLKSSDVVLIDTNRPREVHEFSRAGILSAMAFHSDGKRLAIGGGPANDIALIDVEKIPVRGGAGAVEFPEFANTGSEIGSAIVEVGFESHDKEREFPRILYRHSNKPGNVGPEWLRFDTQTRRIDNIENPPDQRERGQFPDYQRWQLIPSRAPDGKAILTVKGPEGQSVTLKDVDTKLLGHVTTHSFIPPNIEAGHPELSIATSYSGGRILIHDLHEGILTHELMDHQTAVRSLAVSRDGRWLLSGSADQSIRLWPLAGIDRKRTLGATFVVDNGRLVVDRVVPRSFAERDLQLKKLDRIVSVIINGKSLSEPITPQSIDAKIDGFESRFDVRIDLERDGKKISTPLTRMLDKPSLGFFPSVKRDWVLWATEGFYDTSILGDENLLGWHRNNVRVTNAELPVLEKDATFEPISRYEPLLRNEKLINDILAAANPSMEMPTVQVDTPPKILVSDAVAPNQPLEEDVVLDLAENDRATLRILIQADSNRTLKDVVLRQDGVKLNIVDLPPMKQEFPFERVLELKGQESNLSVEATDDLGVRSYRSVGLTRKPVPQEPPPAKPRIVLLTFGVGDFVNLQDGKGDIPYGDQDASLILDSFGRRLQNDANFEAQEIASVEMVGDKATRLDFASTIDQLVAQKENGDLKQGDTVIVNILTHVLVNKFLTPVDFDGGEKSGFAKERLIYGLQALAESGCRVLLILNGFHEDQVMGFSSNFKEMVRELGQNGVFVLYADENEKSVIAGDSHSMTKAIVDICENESKFADLPLDEFADKIAEKTESLSGRKNKPRLKSPPYLGTRVERVKLFRPEIQEIKK
ncbi:hypothetical protein GC170_22440 [bacterium]|nr:hypothetical protein [bacterium]